MSWRAILTLRCPRCKLGKVHQGFLQMHEVCPECGLKFEREPGFFLGAMYFSYALGILAALPVCLLLFFKGSPEWLTASSGMVVIIVLSPLLMRYSRVLWLHFDQRWDPR